jgi:hypothetical protein
MNILELLFVALGVIILKNEFYVKLERYSAIVTAFNCFIFYKGVAPGVQTMLK